MRITDRNANLRGGASIIIVIFSALLMTVITISFAQLMLSDQKQSTANDLSKSAYDSALAGVEDAKRVLLLNQKCQQSGLSDAICVAATAAIQSEKCNTIPAVIPNTPNDGKETMVQQSSGSNNLDQAFTCVKITPNTPDYLVRLQGRSHSTSALVPLVGVSSFDKVRVSWFDSRDYGDGSSAELPAVSDPLELPRPGMIPDEWAIKRPPLLRSQLVQTGKEFNLQDFDNDSGGESNSKTLFLYPHSIGLRAFNFSANIRRSATPINGPHAVACSKVFSGYTCTATLDLPNPIGYSANDRANAFLRLTAVYNNANVKVELLNGTNVVAFRGVQPAVDSTGRASDLFRRVEARIELGSDVAYPEAGINVSGSVCKNFTITDNTIDYMNSASNCL